MILWLYLSPLLQSPSTTAFVERRSVLKGLSKQASVANMKKSGNLKIHRNENKEIHLFSLPQCCPISDHVTISLSITYSRNTLK